ncbi:MAG: hypothetical protein ACI8S6_004172 [Myxococcota bacterium]|jgi:hypothetical protein
MSMPPRRGSFALPLLALMGGAAVAGGVAWRLHSMRSSPACDAALQHLSEHDVDTPLGRPLAAGWWIRGELSGDHARLRIPVSGPDGHGSLLAIARSRDGAWTLDGLTLKLGDDEVPIDLLDTRSEDHDGPAAEALYRARALDAGGRHAEALIALDAVTRSEPALAEGWNLLGRALAALGEEGAEDAFLRAAALDPGDHDSLTRLGMFYYQKARFADCVAAYTDALRITPGDGRDWHNRAACNRDLGDLDRATRDAATGCELGAPAACTMMESLSTASPVIGLGG